MSAPGTFLSDIKEIRRRARQHLSEGAVTQNYGGKVEDAIALLNHAVATEIVCVLRYKFHAVCATGLASEAVKEEFAQHAKGGGRASRPPRRADQSAWRQAGPEPRWRHLARSLRVCRGREP